MKGYFFIAIYFVIYLAARQVCYLVVGQKLLQRSIECELREQSAAKYLWRLCLCHILLIDLPLLVWIFGMGWSPFSVLPIAAFVLARVLQTEVERRFSRTGEIVSRRRAMLTEAAYVVPVAFGVILPILVRID